MGRGGSTCPLRLFSLRVPVNINRYKCMKKARIKYPDQLADSCKRSSVSRMAVGSVGASWIFSPVCNFLNILS